MSLLFIPAASVPIITTLALLMIAVQFKYKNSFDIGKYLTRQAAHLVRCYWINPIQALPLRKEYNFRWIVGGTVTAIGAMSYLTYDVVHNGFLTQWNYPLYYLMRPFRSISADAFWIKISLLNSISMFLFWGIMSLYFIGRRDIWRLIHWVLLGILVGTSTLGLKYATGIARPGEVFPVHDSFPSAHVSTHMTLLGGIILLADLKRRKRDWLIYGLYTLWVGLVAFSRVYFAAHWLTDIFGGVLISVISLGIMSASYFKRVAGPPFRTELSLFKLMSLAGLFLIRFVSEYDAILRFYMASF